MINLYLLIDLDVNIVSLSVEANKRQRIMETLHSGVCDLMPPKVVQNLRRGRLEDILSVILSVLNLMIFASAPSGALVGALSSFSIVVVVLGKGDRGKSQNRKKFHILSNFGLKNAERGNLCNGAKHWDGLKRGSADFSRKNRKLLSLFLNSS